MITDTKLRKVILWIAKAATLVISAPATIGVVDMAYQGKEAGWLLVLLVKVAALLLVEGAFLYFWQLVEDTKSLQTKEENEQTTYVVLAWAMYGLLLFVGVLHGEGAVTLVLRFTIGALLYVATNDKLAAMRKKYEEERIKGKRKTRKERQAEAEAEESVSLALIKARKDAQISALSEQGDLLKQVNTELIMQRILVVLPSSDIVEGEVIEERLELPADIQNSEESEQKTTNDSNVVFDNGSYRIVRHGSDFVVSCYACSYTDKKSDPDDKKALLSAKRAGSKHMGKHKVKEDKEMVEEDNQGF